MVSAQVHVRLGTPADLEVVAGFFVELWTDGSLAEHRAEAQSILSGKPATTLPLVVLVAEAAGAVVGFIEVGLRSHADGCDPRQPAGYVEGWYVAPTHRRCGVGGALMRGAQDWALSQGCRELASDTWIDRDGSQRAHEALGFEVVDRCVHYRKDLP